MEREYQGLPSYRVLLNGDWELSDLYVFPHALSQCYSFIYCLDSELEARDRERIDTAFVGYPWRGGYSYVNIYVVFHNQLPQRHRPRIKSMHKASPGWLEIILNVDVAIQVAKSVGILASAGVGATQAYATAMKILANIKAEREKANLKTVQLTQAQHKVLMSMCEDMAKFLGFKNVKELHQRTGSPEVTLKLLGAHFRRMSDLVKFVKDGKAALPEKIDG
jgi:hypothetical protein